MGPVGVEVPIRRECGGAEIFSREEAILFAHAPSLGDPDFDPDDTFLGVF